MTTNKAILTGAPRPADSSSLYNEWAANNPQPEAIALLSVNFVKPMQQSLRGIFRGARPIDIDKEGV